MKLERLNKIWDFIKEKNHHSTKKIIRWAAQNNISNMQIRRDLHKLEQLGYVSLRYGLIEVISAENNVNFHSIDVPKISNYNFKEEIAKKVNQFIDNNDNVFISSGTTAQFVINNLNKSVKTFLTNGLNSFNISLKNQHIRNRIIIGGEYNADSFSFVGAIAKNQLNDFSINKAFFSCDMVDDDFNIYVDNYRELDFFKELIKHCTKLYLIVDHTKFHRKGLGQLINCNKIDMIVSDDVLDIKIKENIQLKTGCQVI